MFLEPYLLVRNAMEVFAIILYYLGPRAITSVVLVFSAVKLEGWVRPYFSKCGLETSNITVTQAISIKKIS